MPTNKNPLENIEVRVMASGGADYLPTATAMHCKKVDKENGNYGQKLADMYQEIGSQDPLIITAPNPFAWGTFNLYPLKSPLKPQCSPVMVDPSIYFKISLQQPLFNIYPSLNPNNKIHSDIYEGLVLQNIDCNKRSKEDFDYQKQFTAILSSITNGYVDSQTGISYEAPFKDCPKSVRDAIATYICDKFLSVVKDPIRDGEFINTGYFGIAIGLGARYDLKKIETMIKELDPKKAGIQLDDINAVKEYLKGSRLYNELMKTNRYLGLTSTMNVMLNKSVNRGSLYTDPTIPFVKTCKELIRNRDKISPAQYLPFMRQMSGLYCDVLEITDRTNYVTKLQEKALLDTCNRAITPGQYK